MGEGVGKLAIPVKKRKRFTEEDDIILLREVAGLNPFLNSGVWEVIREHVHVLTAKDFSIKSLKDHLDLIIKLWINKTKIIKYKSGIEEEHNEKEQLCQDIYDHMSQFRDKKNKNNSRKIQMENGKKIRDEWARNHHNNIEIEEIDVMEAPPVTDHEYVANFVTIEELHDVANIEPESGSVLDLNPPPVVESRPLPSIPTMSSKRKSVPEPTKVFRPIRARKRKINIQRQGLSYLEEYDQKQLEIKKQDQILEERRICMEEKKIALEEKKLALAEKKFYLDEFEKKKNIEILEGRMGNDTEQRKVMTNIIERQDKIIEMLLLNFQK